MSDDQIVVIHVGEQRHEANLTAMFSQCHKDPVEYAKYLSATYAYWAEIKEQAKLHLTRTKAKYDLLRAQKLLEKDEWYSSRSMKPIKAKLEAQVMSDQEVQQLREQVTSAEYWHGQSRVVTQTLWFQRSLIVRSEGDPNE